MGLKDLFKRYSLKDSIYIEFDPENKKYEYVNLASYFSKDGKYVPYKKLAKDAKEVLDKKNQELIDNPELLKKELAEIERRKKADERERELESMGYSCSSTMIFSDIETSSIPAKFNNYLNNILSEEHVLYGIHRTGYMEPEYLEDILENGLIMTGHGVFVSQDALALNQNVAYYPDNMEIKFELLNAHGYKGSNGSLLIRIPDEDLKKKDLYIEKENEFKRLNPKYIIGYVPLIQLSDGTVTIDRIITLKDIKKNEETTEYIDENVVEETYEEENTRRHGR